MGRTLIPRLKSICDSCMQCKELPTMTGTTGVFWLMPVSSPALRESSRKSFDRSYRCVTRSGSALRIRIAARAAAAFDGEIPTL